MAAVIGGGGGRGGGLQIASCSQQSGHWSPFPGQEWGRASLMFVEKRQTRVLTFDLSQLVVLLRTGTVLYLQYILGCLALRVRTNHMLNMELDLQSLFGLHVHSCTHWLRPRNRDPYPHIRAHKRGRYWSVKIDDISLWLTGTNPKVKYISCRNHLVLCLL